MAKSEKSASGHATSISVDRGAELSSSRRVHEEPALLLALGATVIELARVGAVDALLDRSNIALVPSGAPYRLHKKSPTTQLLTITMGEGAQKDACHDFAPHIDGDEMRELLRLAAFFPRTRWFDEIAQRFLFEREVCQKPASRAARFLEIEIAKEIYFLAKEQKKALGRASIVREQTDIVRRAIALIEEDLFHARNVADLADACGASESTLLRAFQKEMGVAPATYQRDRRLDESLLLLRGNGLSVGEVATRVGYTNLAAFTSAFGRRFGTTPSSIAGEGEPRIVLPPHGMAPKLPRKKNPSHAKQRARRDRRRG